MAHPSIESLLAKYQAARRLGEFDKSDREQLRIHRELAESCPAFTPNLLRLGRLLQFIDEPEVEAEEGFSEIQRLLEQSVRVSDRSAPALVELGYFLDDLRNQPDEAFKLYEEGARSALAALEDAWSGMLRYWTLQRTSDSLRRALQLAEQAEKLFPPSSRIARYIEEAREAAGLFDGS